MVTDHKQPRTDRQIADAVLLFVRETIAKGGTFYIKYPKKEHLDVVTWDLAHIRPAVGGEGDHV